LGGGGTGSRQSGRGQKLVRREFLKRNSKLRRGSGPKNQNDNQGPSLTYADGLRKSTLVIKKPRLYNSLGRRKEHKGTLESVLDLERGGGGRSKGTTGKRSGGDPLREAKGAEQLQQKVGGRNHNRRWVRIHYQAQIPKQRRQVDIGGGHAALPCLQAGQAGNTKIHGPGASWGGDER